MDKLVVLIALLGLVGGAISSIYLILGLISPKLVKAGYRVQVIKRFLVIVVISYVIFKLGVIGFSG